MSRPGSDKPWRRVARIAVRVVLCCGACSLSSPAARATTFVPMGIDDLTASSAAVVIATVERVAGARDGDGSLTTRVDLRIEQTLKGVVTSPTLVLRELGGRVGHVSETVSGVPDYRVGEQGVVFVDIGPGGTLRTNHLALGHYVVTVPPDGGAAHAAQRLGADTTVIVTNTATSWQPVLPLAELIARVRRRAAADPRPLIPLPQDGGAGAGSGVIEETSQPFTRQGLGRFFEPDEGLSVAFAIDQGGDAILGLDVSRQAVDDALRAWTEVESASLVLADGGLTADVGTPCEAGRHIIRFNDPNDQIPDPVGCSGVLGVGGACSTDADQKLFSGQLFHRSLRGAVTFADNWDGCAVWTACNFAEVATHEIGHALGLGHSSEDPNETDARLTEATMYFRGRFDGRCAGVRMDDIDGVTFLYPTELPPTITAPESLPDGTTNSAYSTQLTAIGDALTWSVIADQSCSGFPGLELSSAGVLAGVPTAFGSGCFLIRAEAADGSSHMKRFLIAVQLPGVGTNTPTRSRTATATMPTGTPTPTPTTTPTGTATMPPTATAVVTTTSTPSVTATSARVCVGDCDGNGFVAIDELVRGVNIALDRARVDVCPNVDQNRDGAVTVNELVLAVNNALRGCA